MNFSLARLPRIVFGKGVLGQLPSIIAGFGERVMLVTGGASFLQSRHWTLLEAAFLQQHISFELVKVPGEPSPALVDAVIARHRHAPFDCVVGIGGGSALDAAKAIAGLLRPGNSVMDHLEGVGPELPYSGPSTPFIAIPTTAGTGSEATKNAVLSVHGDQGFKKSFRDEKLMAEWALIDPELLASCPAHILAANGMDAFTQLLESYVSLKANPLTDALSVSGLERVRDSLLPWFEDQRDVAVHQANMAYAALLSGITLANVGLGSVHGLASPLGAFFPIPHGVACGTLVAEATRINIRALMDRSPDSPALGKYAQAGRLLSQQDLGDTSAQAVLVEILKDWTSRLKLPRLRDFGVSETEIPRIVANGRGSSMKTNPIVLSDAEIAEIVRLRL